MEDRPPILIDQLMATTGVSFGTSGARGLADAMTDELCYAYTLAFLQYLRDVGELPLGGEVALAGDLRPSTPRIMEAVAAAVEGIGCCSVNCGFIATPAVALYGLARAIPSIMVTGSHIPDDRNGIKFNKASGEILKPDEEQIRAQQVSLGTELFDSQGRRRQAMELPPVDATAAAEYLARYQDFYPPKILHGKHIGVYQHSSVVRDLLVEILEALGAEVTALGRSDHFIPVDTEAVRPEDVAAALQWVREQPYYALVSTDGDGDRPLVADERGIWWRGDVAGILCARHLGIRHLATPVSSNTAVEKSGWFERVLRTRIGSPYVIAAMQQALNEGAERVAGYEANGGFLLADPVQRGDGQLAALPTRDALILILSLLVEGGDQPLSALLEGLPPRFTHSDRLKAFPTALSQLRLGALNSGSFSADQAAFDALFGSRFGALAEVDHTDGVRLTLANGEVIHLRASGNAPELRCYTEADSMERALEINRQCMEIMQGWREDNVP